MNHDFIFGIRAVIEAVEAGKEIERILLKNGLKGALYHELFGLIKTHRLPFQYVPVEKINRVTRKNHQGVVAFISPVGFHRLENLLPALFESGKTPFLLVLDKITDVRNFGAIVRSAECAGVHAIVIPLKGSARIGADAVKTSAGALHHLPVCRTQNLKQSFRLLKESGLKIFAATEKAQQLYSDNDFTMPLAMVMGAEDKGIDPLILREADELIRIPIQGKIASLNVSAAASILMYEVLRQRNV